MSNSYIFYNFRAEIQGTGSRSEVTFNSCRAMLRRMQGGMKHSRFLTNISLYLRNDARYSHSYYGRRIGNRTKAFKWYQFE